METANVNEVLLSTIEFSKDTYQLFSFGTYKKLYRMTVNGVATGKVYKRLPSDLKDFFNLETK